ncbi:MAG: glycosyltransferase family 2 protein [Lachnospiraceae bacterium]|nr:glycosyltransferase family 2 protein [Lachnospiraceae bacterium]
MDSKDNKKIIVMMSTYNGEKYLPAQLDCILNQTVVDAGVELNILIRDDGSTDGTCDVLEAYKNSYPEVVSYYRGKNKGVAESFFNLMKHAGEADYYAFSDQDDIWHPDKLLEAVKVIDREAVIEDYEGNEVIVPFMYTCAVTLVDEDMNEIVGNINRKNQVASFENALVENISPGCTQVFNKRIFDIVNIQFPKNIYMHDWWIYLVSGCFGKVYFDDTSYIYYVQHEDNAVGMKSDRIKEFWMRVKNQREKKDRLFRHAEELVRIYRPIIDVELYPDDQVDDFKELYRELFDVVPRSRHSCRCLKIAKKFVEVKNEPISSRRRFFNKANIHRQRKEDDWIFKVLLDLGRY